MASLHFSDYIIFALSIFSSFGIGLYYACSKDKNRTTDDYLLAGRRMNIIPVAISFMASFFSAIAMLGNSSEVYYYGVEFWFVMIGIFIGAIIVSYTYVPLLTPLKITSVHEYLLARYNTKFLVTISLVFQCLNLFLMNGVVLYGQAIVLKSFGNIPIWISMLGTGVVSTVYTTIGGYQAVVWSDVFQSIIMFLGLVIINILGTVHVGGPVQVWEMYGKYGKLDLNWSLSPFERSTVWAFALGTIPNAIMLKGCQQITVQRYCSLPSVKQARKSIVIAAFPQAIMISLACMTGVVAFAYFAHIGCDPLRSGQIVNPNQILPHFIKTVLSYPTVPGIFMACITCGTLSNLSSAFNSISAMLWQDFLNDKLKGKHITENRKTIITKLIAFVAGILTICGGFVVSEVKGTLIQIVFGIATAAIAPVWVFITLGALSTKASCKSAVIGGLVAQVIIIWLNTGSNLSGVNKPILDTVITNCTSKSDIIQNKSIINNNNSYINISMYADNNDLSSHLKLPDVVKHLSKNKDVFGVFHINDTLFQLTNDTAQMGKTKPVFLLYKLSFMLIAPFGAMIGLIIGLILLLIPGMQNKEPVEDKYIFTFIRFIRKKIKYRDYKATSRGLYSIDEQEIEEAYTRKGNL